MNTSRRLTDSTISKAVLATFCVVGSVTMAPRLASACGGFFCQSVPINQAGEQIIFRRDGNMVTAVILIQYAGAAEDFSWVLPVPGIPEISVGNDQVFSELELATRPQFNLEIVGSDCPVDFDFFGDVSLAADPGVQLAPEAADSVTILEELVVGPFDIVVVTSDDAEALATWLADNDYDLSDRGEELIAPYVAEGMNFVAMRLRQDQGVGDLQPLIVEYMSPQPMIPIRLTAVAADPDMGVLVWLLGESRAVPTNYLAVEVNYTRLNWYSGTTSAYVSYQGLVTAAMDEAGGQGFATDYAGTDIDSFVSQLTSSQVLRDELTRLAALSTNDFYRDIAFNFFFGQSKILDIQRRRLPLPEGQDEFIYSVPELLADVFGDEMLTTVKGLILGDLLDSEVIPLEETLTIFDNVRYMTRLFTTLSPEDMTLDPVFDFNPDLGDQALVRNAKITLECLNDQTHWQLELGSGTGRDGEVVIEGFGESPVFGFSGPPTIDQPAVATTARVSSVGLPQLVTENDLGMATVGTPAQAAPSIFPIQLCGAGIFGAGMMSFVGLVALTRRRRRPAGD